MRTEGTQGYRIALELPLRPIHSASEPEGGRRTEKKRAAEGESL